MNAFRRMNAAEWVWMTGILFALVPVLASSQVSPFSPDKMDTVLYGVAYYPEYMPYERLEKDVQLMQQAGISVVRM